MLAERNTVGGDVTHALEGIAGSDSAKLVFSIIAEKLLVRGEVGLGRGSGGVGERGLVYARWSNLIRHINYCLKSYRTVVLCYLLFLC